MKIPAFKKLLLPAMAVALAAALLGIGPNPQAIDPSLAGNGPGGIVAGRAIIGILIADFGDGQDFDTVIRRAAAGQDVTAASGAAAGGAVQMITVRTNVSDILIQVDDITRITSPAGTDRVQEMISQGLPVRVAILTDRPLLGPDGAPIDEPATALKLIIIPETATRRHVRVVVAETPAENKVKFVDSGGGIFNLPAKDTRGMEKGDNVVLLVQRDAGGEEQIKAQVDADSVLDRLVRMVQAGQVSAGEAGQVSSLIGLLNQHQGAEEVRLRQTLDNAPQELKALVQETQETLRVSIQTASPGPLAIINTSLIVAAAGRGQGAEISVSMQELHVITQLFLILTAGDNRCDTSEGKKQNNLQQFGIELADYMDSLQDRSPDSEGVDFLPMLYEYDSTLDPNLVVVFLSEALALAGISPIAVVPQVGEAGRIESLAINLGGQQFFVQADPDVTISDESGRISEKDTGQVISPPAGESCLDIVVTVRDESGNTSTTSATVSLNTEPVPHPLPILNIVSPADGEAVDQGTTITLKAKAIGENLELEFSVGGVVLGVEGGAISLDSEGSYIQPYRVPPEISSFVLEVTVTDSFGQTVSASRTVQVNTDSPPTVSIISPGEGELIIAIIAMPIIVRADDDNEVVSVEGILTANGETTSLVFVFDDKASIPALGAVQQLPGMDWRVVVEVPSGTTSLTIEVTATDDSGNTGTATRSFEVAAPPKVSIESPAEGTTVAEGSPVDVNVLISSEGVIVNVEIYWPIVGELGTPNPIADHWVSTLIAPTVSSPPGAVSVLVMPHIFYGEAAIGGLPVPDGTEIIAWVEGGPPTAVDLVATATDETGQKGEDTISISVLPGRIRVASTTVSDGLFVLEVPQLEGGSFAGKVVTFTLNGVEISQSMVWRSGAVDPLDF